MAAAVKGSKGGSKKPKAPYIAPDSARSVATAKMLYALSEGEIEGPVGGMRSVYLEGTPLQDDGGNINFPGVQYEFRPGTVDQSAIPGFPETSNEVSVGVELRSSAPWIRAINNPELSAVRVRLAWPQLHEQKTNGDMVGIRIQYAIDIATDGGAYQTVLDGAVDDKAASRYERAHRIDLPAGSNWLLRVRRLTPNRDNSMVADTMYIDAIAEVIDAKLRYPHTAMLSLQYDSSQFQSIAKFSVLARGRIIQVPSNYDPGTRLYAGIWDGTFKRAYSNNPAWVWYDLVLHPRYGLGRRINASMINKWRLYQIAQWCDVMVPDGLGGLEPRFTCNLYIQSRRQAYSILADIASIFHGNCFWDGAQLAVSADMPEDPIYSYTRANIVDGVIEYKGTALRDRHTLAMVAWDDPTQNFKTLYEPVEGNGIARGVYQADIAAIGTTSLGQAQRAGKWALLSEELETRIGVFRVGLDGHIPRPGSIINLTDELLQGRPNGGRLRAATETTITIDRDAPIGAGSRVIVNLPSGRAQTRTVQEVEGRTVILTDALDEIPAPDAVWVADADDLAAMQYRVNTVRRPEFHRFEITATLHRPDKYPAIDSGARIELPPISVIPAGVQVPPTNVVIAQSVMIEQTMAVTTMTVSWGAAEGAIAYAVEWRKDNSEWVALPRTGGLSVDVRGVYTGQYQARVRAINAIDVQSLPASSALTAITGKSGLPPAVAYLSTVSLVFGIRLDWGFPEGAEDTQRTEIEYNTVQSEEGALHLGDYAYPGDTHTMTGLAAAARFYFRARLVDRTGNIGPWSDWVMGQSSADADEILDYIKGKIGLTEAAQDLLDAIELGHQAGIDVADLRLEVMHQAALLADAVAGAAQDLAAEMEQRAAGDQRISAEVRAEAQARIEQYQEQATELLELAGRLTDTEDGIQRLDQLTAEQALTIEQLQISAGEVASQIINIQQATAEQAQRLTQVETQAGETVGRVQTLESTSANHAAQLVTLTQQTGNNTASITDLAEVVDGQAQVVQDLVVEQGEQKTLITAIQLANAEMALESLHMRAALGETDGQLEQTRQVTADLVTQTNRLQVVAATSASQILEMQQVSADQAVRLTAVETVAGDAMSKATTVEQTAANLATRTSTLETTTGNLGETVGDQQGQIDGLGQTVTQHTNRIATTEQTTADLAQRATTLESTTETLREDVDGVEGEVSQQGTRLQAVEQVTDQQALDALILSAQSGETEGQLSETRQAAADAVGLARRLEVQSADANSKITTLEEVAAGQAIAQQQLETTVDGQTSLINTLQQTQQGQATLIQQVGIKADSAADDAATANNAAAAASQAAAQAAGIAEGKGKTIIQSAAPAAADRLPQNLWIDTTNNNNTPKRWNGSAWVAVTDKAATDAAAQAVAANTAAQAANTAATAAQQAASQAQAAVQITSQALQDLEGHLSAILTLKAQTTVGDRTVISGISIGVEGEEQESSVLVFAQRFAVVDEVTGELTPVFVVEGGQIIANHAIFKQADIINLIVTGELKSPDYIEGTRGMRMNFVTNEFEVNGSAPGQGRLSFNNQLLRVFRPDGGLKLRLGIWG